MDIENKIKKNFPLAPLTTFKIGGAAEYFVKVENGEELAAAMDWADKNAKPVTVLASGSNALVNDGGVSGLTIKINNGEIKMKGERMECGAGAELASVLKLAASHALSGIEWAAGIPGSVGGAVRGNAGAFGHSISESVETVEAFDRRKKKMRIFSRSDCAFSYRASVFKKKKGLLIWRAGIKLKSGNPDEINKRLADILSRRHVSQPKLPSAGCFFKNVGFDDLKSDNPDLAARAEKNDAVKGGKIGAGWLIEEAGLSGKAIGGAKVSLEHANFIVNTGKAAAADVIMLASLIKQRVRDQFGVQLQEEVAYLGFDVC